MLECLRLENVGPASKMEMRLAKRLNLITGHNGLGKSFLLKVAWWALTRQWPVEVNPTVSSGLKARPIKSGCAAIEFSLYSKPKKTLYRSEFDRHAEAWLGPPGRPMNPGLVLYAQADGSFCLWDPARNYWKKTRDADFQERRPAYVFSSREVWNGLREGETHLCNGLLADWAVWQKEGGEAFQQLTSVLAAMSPTSDEQLVPGNLTRLSVNDARWIPTIRMPYGINVPVLHAAAAVRRVLALSYLLVWSWQEHVRAAILLDEPPTAQITFLIDELESHMHPRWQRTIVRSILQVMKILTGKASVQLVATTHSPLILASVEPVFDPAKDAWFDLKLERCEGAAQVLLRKRDFVRLGDVASWLTSEAFGLKMACSVEAEEAMDIALDLLARAERPSPEEVREVDESLRAVLSDIDRFWVRWSAFAEEYIGVSQ